MEQYNKPNFYLFTGGPGAGKSSVLAARGYLTVEEAARKIIIEQNAKGSDATHDGDRVAFCDLLLAHSLQDFQQRVDETELVFFDRGLPELYGYALWAYGKRPEKINQVTKQYRYNPIVFVFPPWEAIYQNDAERSQDFTEAKETYRMVCQAHQDCGYQLVEVPLLDVEQRVEFILSQLVAQS